MVSLLSGRDLDCLMLSRGILLEIQQYINLRVQMILCRMARIELKKTSLISGDEKFFKKCAVDRETSNWWLVPPWEKVP